MEKTLYIESKTESDGFPFTRVRTYNRKLACIYLLDSGTKKGLKYCVLFYGVGWSEHEFNTEREAVSYIIRHFDLFGGIKLNLNDYSNCELGAIKRSEIFNLATN